MAQQLVDMFPIQATADGVGIPLIGMAPQSYLTTVRVMSVFFTGALSLQMGLDNLMGFVNGPGTIEKRVANWKGFADKAAFSKADSAYRFVWFAGVVLMTGLQLTAGACGVISSLGAIGIQIDDTAAPFGCWSMGCGLLSLCAYVVMVLGMRLAKDYPAAAATIPYVTLAAFATFAQLPLANLDSVKAPFSGLPSAGNFAFFEMVTTAFVAAVFIQSGMDKIVDWPGNAGWLSGYFSDTLLAPFWLPGLVTLTVTENIAGFAAALACWQYYAGNTTTGRNTAMLSLVMMEVSLAVIVVGMLFKNDHGQMAPIIPYVTWALLAIAILSLGY